MRLFTCIAVLTLLTDAGAALAQFAGAGGAAAGPSPVVLPASGRNAQGGSVGVSQQPVAGTTSSVNTLNPNVSISGPYGGSARSTTAMPFSGTLSLEDALKRGLTYNLGAIGVAQSARENGAQVNIARSALLPNINSSLGETVEQVDLAAEGLHSLNFNVPGSIPGVGGFHLPSVVGPFNYFALEGTLSQNIVNVTAIDNYRSARATARTGQFNLLDARDLVTLAVAGTYLQVLAAQARLEAAQAELDTANAVFHESSEQHTQGVLGKLNVDQSQLRTLTQQQQIITLRNDLAKQKINLARLVGIPPNADYRLTDSFPFSPSPLLTVDDALAQAAQHRADLKAAESQVEAASKALAAARAERLPSLALSGDYEVIGENPSQSHGAFAITGTLSIPIWQGGKTSADIEQATAVLKQRQAELEDTRAGVEAEIRKVYLDLEAAAGQVEVAQKNVQVAQETLEMTRARMEAGIINTVEVVQSQQTVADAQLDLINSVFAHNLAKLNLARALGNAGEHLPQMLRAQTASTR
jgi:outer membrane protein TolC